MKKFNQTENWKERKEGNKVLNTFNELSEDWTWSLLKLWIYDTDTKIQIQLTRWNTSVDISESGVSVLWKQWVRFVHWFPVILNTSRYRWNGNLLNKKWHQPYYTIIYFQNTDFDLTRYIILFYFFYCNLMQLFNQINQFVSWAQFLSIAYKNVTHYLGRVIGR